MATSTKTRLDSKIFSGENTLAYFAQASVMKKKKFSSIDSRRLTCFGVVKLLFNDSFTRPISGADFAY